MSPRERRFSRARACVFHRNRRKLETTRSLYLSPEVYKTYLFCTSAYFCYCSFIASFHSYSILGDAIDVVPRVTRPAIARKFSGSVCGRSKCAVRMLHQESSVIGLLHMVGAPDLVCKTIIACSRLRDCGERN